MKVICNKAKLCKDSDDCRHKMEHKWLEGCKPDECDTGLKCSCIPVSEPKRDVIEVTKCEKCKFYYWDSDNGAICNYYEKMLDYDITTKPDYCKVIRIIVESEAVK